MILPILFGAIVGIALGLTGGGGSIFAVPLLVYGLEFEMRRAVALSLAVVGLTALYGAIIQAGRGKVRWRAGFVLGFGGVVAAPFGAKIGEWLPEEVSLYLFSALMVVVGILMLRKGEGNKEVPLEWAACKAEAEKSGTQFSWGCAAKLIAAGALTGLLSGAFGVGGGFTIVPALLVVLRLDLGTAIATSLVVIFLVATSGLASNFQHLESGDFKIGIAFLAGAGAGMTGGVLIKKRLPGGILQQVFGWAVLGTAAFMAVRTVLGS